ncbi:hypothetical protein [Streptomyces sp. NPDC002889]|uniref:hypothetical protein n=1 Tax=Streptomyces sp. NPDC002889 TaxID=3364669 RepID=UPI00367FD3D6
MTLTVYTIEMAYAHMRQLQELANRSRAHRPSPTAFGMGENRIAGQADTSRARRHTKKR